MNEKNIFDNRIELRIKQYIAEGNPNPTVLELSGALNLSIEVVDHVLTERFHS